MKKYATLILAGLIMIFPLFGCDNNVKTDDNELALEVTKTFIEELEKNNFDGVKECYTPKLKENTELLEELEETGKTGLTKYNDSNFKLQKVKQCNIHDTTGKITSKYTLNIGDNVELECNIDFDLIKIRKKWYLNADPEINTSASSKSTVLYNADTIELAIKYCQSDIMHRDNEIYNNNNTYIDLEGVTQTVPDAVEERAKITIYDVLGVNQILDSAKPVIYYGEIFEPYWYSQTAQCIFMNSDYEVISDDGNYIHINVSDTTPLTENGVPSKQVLVYGLDTPYN